MSDQYVGEIRVFGFNFAPNQWASCDGQILPIQQNAPLFAILGVNYGGNGTTNFGLPDLQGRAGLDASVPTLVGEQSGAPSITLQVSEIPQHTHNAYVDNGRPQSEAASAQIPSRFATKDVYTYLIDTPAPPLVSLAPQTVSLIGGNGAHENRQPYQVLNYCIALQGIFPARS
ncbi:Microcystin-dependent protein [Andreprevotia lacus DSM 23236]|jgi:microcystin-dependent protein|uniref:Microcystin-dependent protein n=1 Tax=Andreprevotia lacus DSM 23236 TaxID=1121001 RepID=A0A1W1Y0K6_9NEIS|nr:tail fiber protein [Andreprevotia lacus]SMC29657.1 Microcystin-dependent protein [Andreprevotia lacus DSM 23236]